MEAVSAVKMRKSEQVALRARPYALAALEILRRVTLSLDTETSNVSNLDIGCLSPLSLLSAPADMPICLVVVTSDKGLAGSFNTNVLRKALAFTKEHSGMEVIAVGKKGRDFLKRRGVKVVESVTGAGDFADLSETAPVADFIKKGFAERRWSAVHLLYTNFLSALKQEVTNRKILPFDFESLNAIIAGITPTRGKYANMPEVLGKDVKKSGAYVFEPSPEQVLGELLPALLDIEIYHAVLEGNASEHSSRMIAMRNASDNAGELIDELTLQYNKARQAQITKELSEITAGASALES